MPPIRFLCHSYTAARIAVRNGWLPGARYTNLRDVKKFSKLGFLDIDWRQYDFERHLGVARFVRPCVTVARDIVRITSLARVLDEAAELSQHACHIVIVPKSRALEHVLEKEIPPQYILGYSVPTRYGGTKIPPRAFRRRVHLLGGRPDVQRRLADTMNVVSVDGNRFTLDAAYGDYFDGKMFKAHPTDGYKRCLRHSVQSINRLWSDYASPPSFFCATCPFGERAWTKGKNS